MNNCAHQWSYALFTEFRAIYDIEIYCIFTSYIYLYLCLNCRGLLESYLKIGWTRLISVNRWSCFHLIWRNQHQSGEPWYMPLIQGSRVCYRFECSGYITDSKVSPIYWTGHGGIYFILKRLYLYTYTASEMWQDRIALSRGWGLGIWIGKGQG